MQSQLALGLDAPANTDFQTPASMDRPKRRRSRFVSSSLIESGALLQETASANAPGEASSGDVATQSNADGWLIPQDRPAGPSYSNEQTAGSGSGVSVPPGNGRALVSQADVAREFGVTTRTIRTWSRTGILNPVHFGGRVYYRRNEIDARIDSGRSF
jgi:hypothetical protein